MSINEASLSFSNDELESVDFPRVNQTARAWQDIRDGLRRWDVWFLLAYQDIKLRYRRSIIGPFWITLSMAITVYTMGYLYSHLFHIPLGQYFPYLAAGMLSWSLISTSVTDLAEAFILNEAMLKQIKLPYSLYIHRVTARNFLIFFHNLVVFIPLMIIFHEEIPVNWHLLLLIPGLAILYFNCISYGIVLAMLGGRYRDITQIIKSVVQIIFFVTPIMWKPDVLPASKQFVATLNPMYAFIELIRAPLLGNTPSLLSLGIIAIGTIVGVLLCYALFTSRRARIIYWL